jgi:hypothetical protein
LSAPHQRWPRMPPLHTGIGQDMVRGHLLRRGVASGVAACGSSHTTLAEGGLRRVGGLSGGGGTAAVSVAWPVKGVIGLCPVEQEGRVSTGGVFRWAVPFEGDGVSGMASSGWWAMMCCASMPRAVCSLAGGLGCRDGHGLGGGGGGTPEVVPGATENVGSTEVAEAAAHVGLRRAAVAVEAVWAVRRARAARGTWAGRVEGQRGTRFVGPSGSWYHADPTGSWGVLRSNGV